ncbi:GntT/GntP/DsdX family permease [Nocardia miyunensis]|uniref:GntT/GntP/DsdX family permease n=1 Tax=Nocardia miyunensis TaxID=282684 RepID=UPI003F7586C7
MAAAHGPDPAQHAPTAAVSAYHADFGLTPAFGLIVAVPTLIVCGPLLTRFTRRWYRSRQRTAHDFPISPSRPWMAKYVVPQAIRSKTAAKPCPPPIHIVSSAYRC